MALAARKHATEAAPGPPPPAPPFRDSPLTWLLREALVGDSRTWMMACVDSSDAQRSETHSTLRYASSARCLRTKAKVNVDPVAALVKALREEVEALKAELARRAGGAVAVFTAAPVVALPPEPALALRAALGFLAAADDLCAEIDDPDDDGGASEDDGASDAGWQAS